MSLADQLPETWKSALTDAVGQPSFQALEAFVDAEYSSATVFPPREEIFAALAHTAPEAVKIVLLGQDPYPTAGNANGLAFSVTRSVKVPASLKNLFLGLQADLGLPIPAHGDLTAWANRGVLLLNTVLTVREKEANSHQKKGWEPFTTAILRHVASQPRKVVFLCLGKPALKLVESLESQQPIVAAPHPSPLNKTAFVDTARSERIFTKIDGLLGQPFDWSL
ncbi:MAG: uracil-DNA glycosylase [Myxococcota bacterium]